MLHSTKAFGKTLCTAVAVVFFAATLSAQATLDLNGSASVARGQTVSVDITADTSSMSQSLSAFSARVSFDDSELSLNSADFSSSVWPGTGFQSAVEDASGSIRIAAVADTSSGANSVPTGSNQTYIELEFLAAAGSNDCSSTSLSFDTTSIDDNILVDVNAGFIDSGSGLSLIGHNLSIIPTPGFVRGNANGSAVDGSDADASVTLADGIFILQDLFGGGSAPPCADAADANNDARYNIVDAVTVFQYLFGNGNVSIPAPFFEVGSDSGGSLGCGTLPSVSC